MDQATIHAIIGVLPQLILVLVLVLALIRYQGPLSELIEQRVTSVSAFGFQVELRPSEIDAAVQARVPGANAPPADRLTGTSEQVVERAKRNRAHHSGRVVLWVDDHPAGNRIERRLLRQLGIFVETVMTNDEATAVLSDPSETIDLVISDIQRDNGPSGLELLPTLAGRDRRPVIFYVGRTDPSRAAPAGAFGITARPDELLNLVMDALDRSPGRSG